MHSSVREIRTRLLLLLARAFVLVLFLSLFFFLAVVIYFLTSPVSNSPMPFSGTLQGYYIGHGGWNGVEAVFSDNRELKSLNTVLLDENQRVILDRRTAAALPPGSPYEIQPDDLVFPLKIQDREIGTLVVTSFSIWNRLGFVRGIIIPAGIISFILVLFLIVVAILLVRRFVNPLADVIYAARAVADGKLNARISSDGPQDLRGLSESFNEMASTLERNDRERRDMLADIAHELRTPLSVIRGRLEGIMDGIYSADGSQVSLALEQTYLLQRLVEDLRLLTLAETRELRFERKKFDFSQLIQRCIEMFSAEAREKDISIYLDKSAGDFVLELDPQRTEQVIGNLIGNALQYTPVGSKVWLVLEEHMDIVRVSVNDNGPGVAEDDLPLIFERFWRKDKSRTRSSGGSGLGLAIAKQLIEAQGGMIEAHNLDEGGLQIVVILKRVKS